MSKRPIFITGIGTGIGKTIVSAVMVEHFKADYWKPIQSGDLDNSDTLMVKSLISNSTSVFHPEAYRLTQPYSPHKSAALDGITIDPAKIILPKTQNQLIIEGAGGLMVPLNDTFLMIDLIKQLDAEVILVSKNYLGSINHTLLSIEALKYRSIPLKMIIFNGEPDVDSESIIKAKAQNISTYSIPNLSPDKFGILSVSNQLAL
ncbi:MAG: dethiobiotin synthase [Mucilaginibacter sp.]|uniref:dethiobiotin synthase n=1 Tax=Mucilaginibacter sp. TaxID=1882438 RepID=UPI003264341F